MSVAVVFLGLTKEAAAAKLKNFSEDEVKRLPPEGAWNEGSKPFRAIRRAVFELFQATHDGIKEMVDEPSSTTVANLFVAARCTPEGFKYGMSSIDKDSASFALLQTCLEKYGPRTFVLEIIRPEEGGMSKLLQKGTEKTGTNPLVGNTVATYCLLPFWGKWYDDEKVDKHTLDDDNFYLPYLRESEDYLPAKWEVLHNMSSAALHNDRVMKEEVRLSANVGAKMTTTLADQHSDLFGCAYCSGPNKTQSFGCAYCSKQQ